MWRSSSWVQWFYSMNDKGLAASDFEIGESAIVMIVASMLQLLAFFFSLYGSLDWLVSALSAPIPRTVDLYMHSEHPRLDRQFIRKREARAVSFVVNELCSFRSARRIWVRSVKTGCCTPNGCIPTSDLPADGVTIIGR